MCANRPNSWLNAVGPGDRGLNSHSLKTADQAGSGGSARRASRPGWPQRGHGLQPGAGCWRPAEPHTWAGRPERRLIVPVRGTAAGRGPGHVLVFVAGVVPWGWVVVVPVDVVTGIGILRSSSLVSEEAQHPTALLWPSALPPPPRKTRGVCAPRTPAVTGATPATQLKICI